MKLSDIQNKIVGYKMPDQSWGFDELVLKNDVYVATVETTGYITALKAKERLETLLPEAKVLSFEKVQTAIFDHFVTKVKFVLKEA